MTTDRKKKKPCNPRLLALEILLVFFRDKKKLDLLLQQQEGLPPLTKALCFGLCRHYFQLEIVADYLLTKRPKESDLWLIIVMGLYQLMFLQEPDYAIVAETVGLVEARKKPWAKGLVNAVLRRFCRDKDPILKTLAQNPAFAANHPEWFVLSLQKDWPMHWQRILAENDVQAPMGLRVNARQLSREDYLKHLQDQGTTASIAEFSPVGLLLDVPVPVKELPGFQAGEVSIQDFSAQLAAPLLSLKPGMRVLDVCAAPGGKTCHILESEALLADCVALDIDHRRMQRLEENLARLDLKAMVQVGDALSPETWWDGRLFDRILLDAPCTATGVIRRHPDIKILRTSADVQAAIKIQAQLLESIWPLLKTGGMMLYATCSVLKAENEEQIARFMATHPDCTLQTCKKPWGLDTGRGWQLFPGDHSGDGFFYSILVREQAT